MNKLAIWLPTYKRPHAIAGVAKNIEDTTHNTFTLYFGLEPDDTEGIKVAKATGHHVVINKYDMGYSNTIQSMYEKSIEPFWVHANDDFEFFPRWDEAPIEMFAVIGVKVVGVPQRVEDTDCSAVCFGRRSYIDEDSGVIDMPKRVFYPYHHNYQDTEFTQTAQKRGVWAKSLFPCINHKHPGFTGEEKDDTYKKNDATAGKDQETFESRKHLWQ